MSGELPQNAPTYGSAMSSARRCRYSYRPFCRYVRKRDSVAPDAMRSRRQEDFCDAKKRKKKEVAEGDASSEPPNSGIAPPHTAPPAARL